MTSARTAQQIETLIQLKTAKYQAAGNPHPEVAAQFSIENILTMYKTQMEYLDQLLDEEIEDAVRAA